MTPHTLRHTFASVAGDLGFSELTIAALLVSRGAAWSFEKEPGVYHGPPNEMHHYSMKLFEQRGHAATGNYP